MIKPIRVVVACCLIATVMLLVLQRHEYQASAPAVAIATDSTDKPSASENDVQWVYMSWPIPSVYVSDPLIGSRDQDRIVQLLNWLDEAKPIDGQGLTSPMMGRSMAVNVEYTNHDILQIRPAWHCTSKSDEKGNTETSCTPVDHMIWVSDPDKGDYFAESEKLFDFVKEGYLEWLPNVKPYEVPAELKQGDEFTIVGHGARVDEVEISLSQGDQIILKQNVVVNEGEWQATGKIPEDLPVGDYDWRINNGETRYGVGVHVLNK
ncbi:hypothetical protein [Paenibacillus sp. YAF4_2]|uniref:hypothetical protein n=1 Tax=Paenibacillus sp. YAF4_2 TaxID=3233085 RepID=UPI003F96052E